MRHVSCSLVRGAFSCQIFFPMVPYIVPLHPDAISLDLSLRTSTGQRSLTVPNRQSRNGAVTNGAAWSKASARRFRISFQVKRWCLKGHLKGPRLFSRLPKAQSWQVAQKSSQSDSTSGNCCRDKVVLVGERVDHGCKMCQMKVPRMSSLPHNEPHG